MTSLTKRKTGGSLVRPQGNAQDVTSTTHRRRRRRRLTVPSAWEEIGVGANEPSSKGCSSKAEAVRGGAYHDSTVWQSRLLDRSSRPFPTSQIMASMSTFGSEEKNATRTIKSHATKVPLLAEFYESLSSLQQEENEEADDNINNNTAQGSSFSATGNKEQMDTNAGSTSGQPNGLNQDQSSQTKLQEIAPSDPIDDPSYSTLTKTQHARYLQISAKSQTQRTFNKPQQHELRVLSTLVRQEQESYRRELYHFYLRNHRANHFAHLALNVSKCINKLHRQSLQEQNLLRFGPCRQTFSMEARPFHEKHASLAEPTVQQGEWLDLIDLLQFETVQIADSLLPQESLSISTTEKYPLSLLPIPTTVLPILPTSNEKNKYQPKLVRDDPTAHRLAFQYQASIITSGETVECLLQTTQQQGSSTLQWMIPLSILSITSNRIAGQAKHAHSQSFNATSSSVRPNSKNRNTSPNRDVFCLDIPLSLPYASPRACLTKGFEEGLYDWLGNATDDDGDDDDNDDDGAQKDPNSINSPNKTRNEYDPDWILPNSRYVYTIWTLPSSASSGSSAPLRILLRSLIRPVYEMCNNLNTNNRSRDGRSKLLPVRLRTHVEYFPERGREQWTAQEQALWIFDHHLFLSMAASTASKMQHEADRKKLNQQTPQHHLRTDTHQQNRARSDEQNYRNLYRSMTARIDPKSCQILEWEETSMAHAMEEGSDSLVLDSSSSSPITSCSSSIAMGQDSATFVRTTSLLQWKMMVSLFRSIPTIGGASSRSRILRRTSGLDGRSTTISQEDIHAETKQDYLLCFPGQGVVSNSLKCVSVHGPMETTFDATTGGPPMDNTDGKSQTPGTQDKNQIKSLDGAKRQSNGVINLEEMLETGIGVRLGQSSAILGQCPCDWKWEDVMEKRQQSKQQQQQQTTPPPDDHVVNSALPVQMRTPIQIPSPMIPFTFPVRETPAATKK